MLCKSPQAPKITVGGCSFTTHILEGQGDGSVAVLSSWLGL